MPGSIYNFQGCASFIDVLDWDREMGQGRFGSAATAHPASPSLPFCVGTDGQT